MPFKETIMNRIEELLAEIEFEIVFIHNMGRCGSNYICNLLSNYDQDIQCVKETNILIQISHCYLNQAQKDKNYDDENMIELVRVSLILLVYSLLKNTNFKKKKIIFKEFISFHPLDSHLLLSSKFIKFYNFCD